MFESMFLASIMTPIPLLIATGSYSIGEVQICKIFNCMQGVHYSSTRENDVKLFILYILQQWGASFSPEGMKTFKSYMS
jgi:hypothetical protein